MKIDKKPTAPSPTESLPSSAKKIELNIAEVPTRPPPTTTKAGIQIVTTAKATTQAVTLAGMFLIERELENSFETTVDVH